VFFDEKMWNGYDARLVDSTGAKKNGIEQTRDRMVGRGVLLDVARLRGGYLDDGYGISSAELDECAAAQGVEMSTTSPEEFAKLIAADFGNLGKVIRDAGIKMQ